MLFKYGHFLRFPNAPCTFACVQNTRVKCVFETIIWIGIIRDLAGVVDWQSTFII
jgi:hypothetical protein